MLLFFLDGLFCRSTPAAWKQIESLSSGRTYDSSDELDQPFVGFGQGIKDALVRVERVFDFCWVRGDVSLLSLASTKEKEVEITHDILLTADDDVLLSIIDVHEPLRVDGWHWLPDRPT